MKHACHQISRITSEAMDRPLTTTEWLRLRLHLSMCRMCRNYDDNLKKLHTVLTTLSTEETIGSSLSKKERQHILESLKNIVDN